MTAEAIKTLFHPFEIDAVAMPAADATVLFLGAEPGFRAPECFPKAITAIQGVRPSYLKLQREGRQVLPQPGGEGYDVALVLCGRHRGENEFRVAEAIGRTSDGALIVVAGAKDDGIASLRRRMSKLVEIGGHTPKHHGVAFWFARPADAAAVEAILRAENPDTMIEDRFRAAPGMFSHDRVDAGSRLLAQSLPGDIKGAAADFCAGWGYLAGEIAGRFASVTALDLYEADFASLEAAKLNLADASVPTRFFWHDLATEEVAARYDVVVMNPPFHASRAADPHIGQAMIGAASRALKRGGRLMMVANRQLPYETVIAGLFSEHREVAGDGRFKVLFARR